MSFQALNSVRRASGSVSQGLELFPDLLEKSRMEIQRALPKHLDSDRMMRLALTAFRLNDKLAECDPMSVLAAVVQASQMGLEIGLNGEAFLVPFKRECQLIPGYQGLMKLARQSGFVDDIYAIEVYEKDEFDIDYGAERKLVHKPYRMRNGFPAAKSARGALVGFYAVALLTNGKINFVHLANEDCEAIRDTSSGFRYAMSNNRSHPWITDYPEMGKKTAIRMLSKQIPKSPHLSLALSLDALSNEGLKQRITLQQAADGTYEPSDEHFEAKRESSNQRPAAPAQPPQSPPQRTYAARPDSQAGAPAPAASRGPAPVARPPAQTPPPPQRPASAPRQAPAASPVAQQPAPSPKPQGGSASAQAPMPQTSKEQNNLNAANSLLEKMRKAPTMDRVNDIYIEAEELLTGAGLEAVSREYMVMKSKLESTGTRPMF